MHVPGTAALLATGAAALVLAGCGSGGDHGSSGSPAGGGSGAAISVAAGDRAACAQLYAQLQRVTAAIDASSHLLTNSVNAQQLSSQIAVEQQQLSRSADLVSQAPAPAPLVPATRDLVAALRTLSADFGRAKDPAARSDFQAAVAAMTDERAVRRILSAATKIEKACA